MVEQSFRESLCFGLHDGRSLIGFARLITGRVTQDCMADVDGLNPGIHKKNKGPS
jgi:hypothetical protein